MHRGPSAESSGTHGVDALVELLRGRRVVGLVGAGCSTASGIPDYRGPRPDGTARDEARTPIQYRTFVGDDAGRRRYWARAVVGWPRFRDSRPNSAHTALAALERAGALRGLITQNVDRLHHAAGSQRVVELHGALHEVECLSCRGVESRDSLQARLLALNPGWDRFAAEQAPDGDAELPAEVIEGFVLASCQRCGGVLKPRVVFFGENVPPDVTAAAWSLFDEAEVLLVVGSSLTVFSGFRFVRKAAQRGVPTAVVNLGPTRGDPLVQLRVDDRVETVLPELVRRLT